MHLSGLAVFILSTTRKNGKHDPQRYANYFESRMLPITNTYGSQLDIFFVFGTNKYDLDFLNQRCSLHSADVHDNSKVGRRSLKARKAQTRPMNRLEEYKCPLHREESYKYQKQQKTSAKVLPAADLQGLDREITVLRAANCTGEYFGYGPTCRCQETMRYFISQSVSYDNSAGRSKNRWEWFMFIDDDIYMRPYAVLSFINTFEKQHKKQLKDSGGTTSSTPLVVVATSKLKGFEFSKVWKHDGNGRLRSQEQESRQKFSNVTDALPINCSVPGVHRFSRAQPVLINREAIVQMRTAIDANALTDLQSVWGGTHDCLLGMLLWMYRMPTYSMDNVLFGAELMVFNGTDRITTLPKHIKEMKQDRQRAFTDYVYFHRVQGMQRYRRVKKTGQLVPHRGFIASHYDIARLLGEETAYESEGTGTALEEMKAIQSRAGERAASQLRRMDVEGSGKRGKAGVAATVFAEKALSLSTQYHPFAPEDCALSPQYIVS